MEFRLPNLGEGIDGGTITAVLVRPGDMVKAGQNVVTIETDKAAVDVPIESDGLVEAVQVKLGDKVAIGTPLLTLKTGSPAPAAAAPRPAAAAAAPPPPVATSAAANRAATGDTPSFHPGQSPATSSASAAGATTAFNLPHLGEGIDTGTITAIFVKPGDTVKAGQNVVAVETDKAAVDVPVESDGTVVSVDVQLGDKVAIGGKLLTLKALTPTTAPTAAVAAASVAERESAASPARVAATTSNGRVATLPAAPAAPPVPVPRFDIPASPATRKLARELGVSLSEIRGSGRGGRVTLEDVKAFVRNERQRLKDSGSLAPVPAAAASGSIVNVFTLPPLPDFSKFGPIEVTEMPIIRQTIAKNLTIGWRTMPMVTQHELADITELEAGRKRIVEALPKGSPKITMTVLAIKACVAALKEFPRFNSSYDMNAGQLILKKYYHIGIAVDTERGLVVPVIRDADKKSIRDLAYEVASLASKARENKLTIDEMRGGTFTITNLGGIGGTAFTPIVNYPEVAILGLSKSTLQPVVKDGQIVARLMMPLSLTYDHRVIDGADGCRFTVRLAQLFSDPLRLLMET
ncbi:MAG: 2-oxo acid dehydrogenase subunit E2 [Gemmataceae bacterium]|nr:2-oxo acid dehydrogenase subunit E2 [Gemmata sp.]MDW8198734.1 2-oxo acid dehydrogenase subunit E2 [Gemmataceae bacterium]